MKNKKPSILAELNPLTALQSALFTTQKRRVKETAEPSYIGFDRQELVKSQLYIYAEDKVEEQIQLSNFEFLADEPSQNHWLNFHGLHQEKLIKQVCDLAKLDKLTTRNVLDTTIRSKMEDYESYLFVCVKAIVKDKAGNTTIEQISFILKPSLLISFQEIDGDHFNYIRNKINENLGLVRKRKTDFLLYQMLDAILDIYFQSIEDLLIKLKSINDEVLDKPSQATLLNIESSKQLVEIIKKSILPFRDAVKSLQISNSPLIEKVNKKYFEEVLHNSNSALDEIESVSKRLDSLSTIYFSALSNKMNEIMKVLTTVSTIFIPLSFITGLYGMNFVNIPELNNPNGYYYTLISMGVAVAGMFFYFRKKEWI